MSFNLFQNINPQPIIKPRRKVFISYHHANDQRYKDTLIQILGDSVIHKSVLDGDISTDVSTDYIAKLIREGYLSDTSVCIVLVGSDTHKRKHVDWEIAGTLDMRVGGTHGGLLGICLPTNSAFNQSSCSLNNTPERLYHNVISGYAKYYDWTSDKETILLRIEEAFNNRKNTEKIINRSIPQMKYNKA